jgi:hypothetical protein
VLQEFINKHPELEFIQLGKEPVPFSRVSNLPDNTLEDTIKLIATASLLIGIISGPMHVAAALGLRSIVIINFPPAHKIFLPTLVDIDQVESEWFYPQNVHLHEEGEGPQVPMLLQPDAGDGLQRGGLSVLVRSVPKSDQRTFMKIGFIGLGKLGLPCALAIESRGHEVIGFDLSQPCGKTSPRNGFPTRGGSAGFAGRQPPSGRGRV